MTDLPQYCDCQTLVLGCGNVLLGDDGFGPAVIEYLSSSDGLPEGVCLVDAGTGARRILATLAAAESRPERVFLVDCVDRGGVPGEDAEMNCDEAMPARKLPLHLTITPDLISELREQGIEVRLFVCQGSRLPDEVSPGLSAEMSRAVPRMARRMTAALLSGGTSHP